MLLDLEQLYLEVPGFPVKAGEDLPLGAEASRQGPGLA
jgi:hypothetical protein